MNHRRTAPWIAALSALMVTACAPDSAARTESGPEKVRELLASADDAPSSAALRAVTQSGSDRLQLMEGRLNLNAPLTGRTTDTTAQYTEDVVITREKVYRRAVGTRGAWQEFPAATAKGGVPVDRLPQFVRFLLDHDATVDRESDPVHVSARVTPKDVESVDRTAGRNLRPATTVDAEAWVDGQGRVVRIRENMHFSSGPDIRLSLELTDFRSAIEVSAPTRGSA
ncbi:hypothetical protein [Streptomyces sp. NBC_01789]|uniref:hypothetical protein n=1 Tax=Streptomyces sp. NBC_01789 TaxID=2975941 RepID=UPI002251A8DD|nr:hypothetical protein [Streptomyces sp. NBC_01789]MCX4450774.1 hypothetical protein [Streptomyces sp. NBC_01789]